MKGKVKWFNANKGFGFIVSEDNRECFAHWSSIVSKSNKDVKTLEQDETVEFDLQESGKGLQAVNIVRLNQ